MGKNNARVWTCAGMCAAGLMGLLGGRAAVAAEAAAPQAQGEAKVEVRGIRVVGDPYGSQMRGLRAFGWQKGTAVAVLVMSPEGGLIKGKGSDIELTKMSDDKGTDLLAGEEKMQMSFMRPPEIRTDGKACMVELDSRDIPSPGATAILASGIIHLKCGAKKETFTQADVALKPQTKISAGKILFQIVDVGKPQMYGMRMTKPGAAEAQFEVTLQANQDCSGVAGIAFLDAAGKDLAALAGPSTSMSLGTMTTEQRSFILPMKLDTATIAITYWTEIKDIKVPFEVKATVGLQ